MQCAHALAKYSTSLHLLCLLSQLQHLSVSVCSRGTNRNQAREMLGGRFAARHETYQKMPEERGRHLGTVNALDLAEGTYIADETRLVS